jgi:hypothetical protein
MNALSYECRIHLTIYQNMFTQLESSNTSLFRAFLHVEKKPAYAYYSEYKLSLSQMSFIIKEKLMNETANKD